MDSYPDVDPPMDPPDAPVQRILERAARITGNEAIALDAAIRAGPLTDADAEAVLEEHQRYLNSWAMFDHWPRPWVEMGWARTRVYAALGLPGDRVAIEPDDGTVASGAATAAAYAVLAAGRAGAAAEFRAAWDSIIEE